MIEAAVAAIKAGRLAIVPTDTVYGLATTPYSEAPVRRLYRAKGRADLQPTALVAADLELLFECVPELRGKSGTIARALLPGPYTLVLPNPGRRFRWLTGSNPGAIGVRVPDAGGAGPRGSRRRRCVCRHEREPARRAGSRDRRRRAAGAQRRRSTRSSTRARCPERPSTVLDFTGPEPRVLRDGAVPAEDALRLVARLV